MPISLPLHILYASLALVKTFVLILLLAPAAGADDQDAAKQHYQDGAAAYERGEYRVAVDEFDKAWQLSHSPALLFNLARAETKLGHNEIALRYLRQYLEAAPDSPDVPTIRSEIEAREAAIAAQKKALEEQHALAESERREKRARANERARSRSRLRIAGFALFGAGVAVLAGGLGAGLVANSDASTVSTHGAADPDSAPVPYNRVADAANEGQAAFAAGLSLDIVGGVLVAVSFGILGWSSTH
jgi:tetratricopeptide (TPR) repeat protein